MPRFLTQNDLSPFVRYAHRQTFSADSQPYTVQAYDHRLFYVVSGSGTAELPGGSVSRNIFSSMCSALLSLSVSVRVYAAASGGMPTAKGRCAAALPHTGLLWIQFSLRMPNSLRRMPHSAFGLRMTTTCISTPPFAHVYPIIASDGQKCSGKRFNLRWSPPPQARPAGC